MIRNEVRGVALGILLLQAACSSKDPLLQTRDAGGGGGPGSGGGGAGAGGAVAPGTGGIAVMGSGGVGGKGRGGSVGIESGGNAGGGRAGAGAGGGGGGGRGGSAGLGTGGSGGAAGTGGGGSAGVGGSPGVPPVACSLVTTLAECEARGDCHSSFMDPQNCSCPTLGCCAQFRACVDGEQAMCSADSGIACGARTPYCEGSYVVAYTKTCFEGCVQNKDCAPTGSIPCGTTTCGPDQACVHPPRGGTCLMPDAGQCPSGTSPMGSPPCCLPPDKPACVTIDRPCSGTTVTCSCFSVDPCDAHLTNACAASLIQGRDIECHGA